jgi:hypothetical protein
MSKFKTGTILKHDNATYVVISKKRALELSKLDIQIFEYKATGQPMIQVNS